MRDNSAPFSAPVRLSGERKATMRTVRPLTDAEYLAAWPEREISPILTPDQTGVMREIRWNGKPKTWKTRPGDIDRPAKWGMYDCFHCGTTPGTYTAYTLA